MSVIIGHDTKNQPITIGDIVRRSGLYLLGKSGMGKTNLIIKLIMQDRANGHGVFFLDPHDGIDRLKSAYDSRQPDLVELNVKDPAGSFGINLLKCNNVASWTARTDTYDRVRWVFFKLFEKEYGDMPWFESIIQNTLYVFIENQEYTLAEMPYFLMNADFRNYLVSKVRYKPEVVDFWKHVFYPKQAESAITRLTTLLGHDTVKHIVGQRETTLDFSRIMAERRIMLIKLPATLAPDIKKFIGTILISELLHAVRKRDEIPEEERHQFCIFVDEFQHFVNYEDFGILLTEARKYGIATTISHQERFGQLGDNKQIIGATDATVNKVFFLLSVRDAVEQALEFTGPPPTETKVEQELVISQEPVNHLLRGHPNLAIRRFVDQYLRRLQHQLEDIKEDMEGERLIKMALLDDAALSRVDEGRERMFAAMVRGRDVPISQKALDTTEQILLHAQEQTDKLRNLHENAIRTRLTIRSFNSFLTALMEGRLVLKHGQESYSAFLIAAVRGLMNVPARYTTFNPLFLYIAVAYGDPQIPRTIPFDFARTHGLFADEVTMLIRQSLAKTRQAKEAFQERYLQEWLTGLEIREKKDYLATNVLKREREERLAKIEERYYREPFPVDRQSLWHAPRIYVTNVWRMCYLEVDILVTPFSTTQFTPQWKRLVTTQYTPEWKQPVANIDNLILQINESFHESSTPGADLSKWYKRYVNWGVIDNLVRFLRQYREGAFVMLALIDCARSGGWHFDRRHEYPYSNWYTSMINFPAIAGVEPIDVLRVVKKLNEFMMEKEEDYVSRLQYFDRKPSRSWKTNELMWKKQNFFDRSRPLNTEEYLSDITDEKAFLSLTPAELYKIGNQEQMQLLETMLTDRRIWFGHQYPEWSYSDELTRSYFLARASDLISFGENLANQTFPQPTGAEGLVSALVGLYEDVTQAKLEVEWKERVAKERQWSEERSTYQIAKISVSPPEQFEPRVLKSNEINAVKEACRNELLHGEEAVWGKAVLTVLEDFVEFCHLISLPENHIKVQTGNYVEKQVSSRSIKDMIDETAQELASLSPYTAYAKVITNNEQTVWRGKIKTVLVPRFSFKQGIYIGVKTPMYSCLHSREEIEQEIRQRVERWRGSATDEPPPIRG